MNDTKFLEMERVTLHGFTFIKYVCEQDHILILRLMLDGINMGNYRIFYYLFLGNFYKNQIEVNSVLVRYGGYWGYRYRFGMGDFGDIGIGLNILLTDTDISVSVSLYRYRSNSTDVEYQYF